MFDSIFSGATALMRGLRFASRYRATERADIDALRRAIRILYDARQSIIADDVAKFGTSTAGDPKWTKCYHAQVAIESQLNDVISLAMGEKLK